MVICVVIYWTWRTCSPVAAAAQAKAKGQRRKVPSRTDYIERPRATGPTPLETIKLEPGVSLKGAHGAKSGPPQKSSPADMTRSEFVAYAAKKNKASRAAAAMYPPAGAGGSRGASRGTAASPLATATTQGSGGADLAAPAAAIGQAAGAATAGAEDAAAATGASARSAAAQARAADAGAGRGPGAGGAVAARRRSVEVPGREAAGKMGPGSLGPGARSGTQPPKAPRERGLKGPLRRRTEDLPEWVQQGKLKPLSKDGGLGKRGGAEKKQPVAFQASTAGFEPPPGLPVTKPTLKSISSTRASALPSAMCACALLAQSAVHSWTLYRTGMQCT